MSLIFRFLKKLYPRTKKISSKETEMEEKSKKMTIEKKISISDQKQPEIIKKDIKKEENVIIKPKSEKIEESTSKNKSETVRKPKKKVVREKDPYGHEYVTDLMLWQQKSRSGFSTPLGSRIIPIDGIDSTNDYINEYPFLPSGTIIVARRQRKGRGQRQRKWISNVGGLYLSIKFVFHEEIAPSQTKLFWIQTAIVISICKTLEKFGLTPSLKWPNDIMISGKKIAGILGESKLGNQGLVIVMGLGVNVENNIDEIITEIPELDGKISSVKEELNKVENYQFPSSLLMETFKNAMVYLDAYWNSDFPVEILKKEWLGYSNIIDKKISFKDLENESFTATVNNVTEYGSLLVTTQNGEKKELTIGEIELI
jgi:BirA family biotin operon repressor/biotin-[acetyl-CoA-carboxylase] ligase